MTDQLRERTQNNENLTAPAPTNGASPTLEKDFSNDNYNNGSYQYLDARHDSETALRKIRTAGSISISPELFEKLYLSPQTKVKGDLRQTFGNPTPIALIGFLLSLTPLSMDLMGWRGAGGNGAASTGVYFFFGGVLMAIGSLGEFIIGNTFPCVVFGTFAAFWLAYGATLQPFYNSYGAYSTTGDPTDGLTTVGFRSSFAFFLLAMGFVCFVFLICSLRTNFCFFMIFLTLVCAFSMLAASYWQANNGAMVMASRLQVAGGAFAFATCAFGWWIFVAILLAAVDFPFALPVGDLSGMIKGASARKKEKESV